MREKERKEKNAYVSIETGERLAMFSPQPVNNTTHNNRRQAD